MALDSGLLESLERERPLHSGLNRRRCLCSPHPILIVMPDVAVLTTGLERDCRVVLSVLRRYCCRSRSPTSILDLWDFGVPVELCEFSGEKSVQNCTTSSRILAVFW